MTISIYLKLGREKTLKNHHPWVFSGAIDETRIKVAPQVGEVVTLRTAEGGFLAHAGWSPASQIRARVWSFVEGQTVDAEMIAAKLKAAYLRRSLLGFLSNDAFRWVHGESDGLPGLVIDAYGAVVVFSISAAMMEPWRAAIIAQIVATRSPRAVVERSDAEVRTLEGLPVRCEISVGTLDAPIALREHGIAYEIDVQTGHKTGAYLDQTDNRALIQTLAAGKRVLNCFCYTGGFSLAAAKAGAAHVTSIDASAEAIAAAQRNVKANGLDEARFDWHTSDVFETLRKLRDKGAQFDLIVLDPPKFAPSAAHAEKAARAYKDINLWAMKLLAPGGQLMTFSCSGGIDDALFQKIIAGAAMDAHAELHIVKKLAASADHPIALDFPEGHYLKGLLLMKAG